MPKKQRNNYLKQLQGTSSGNKAASTNVANTKSSVNERLGELRKLEGKDAAKKKAELAESSTNHKPDKLGKFALMSGIENDESFNQRPGSLVHVALKTAAQNWHMFDEVDLPILSELPLTLRLKLLSYLGFYGPSIDINTLDALTSGTEPLSHLDLAGLIGSGGDYSSAQQ
ncbi:hypothetical protein CERZMDRAFT_120301 [Cercospora zeae-maydis SCOH1-5]|uniref:Uncharacterized protein n=1 Tax=Cercospora zeae-maydis SCOH1-5 TaxID=717836 RepID=A0A6A6FQC0_9PEZI|nr:hypothetical protein CERZMDRAFT_120301 [Cercospora zeae-maydis SCOH1-5]